MRPSNRQHPAGALSWWAAALVLLLAVSMWAGCMAHRRNPRKDLMKTLDAYHTDLIWGRYPEAAGYLPVEQRGAYLGMFDEADDDIAFTEYEIGAVNLNEEAEEAIVMVTLEWYRVPYYVIEETRIRETWTVNEEDDYWWLTERSDPDDPVSTERYQFAQELLEE